MVNQSVSYSSTDNFLITYSGSDWLIFCCENSIHYQKKTRVTRVSLYLKSLYMRNKSVIIFLWRLVPGPVIWPPVLRFC